MLLEKGRFELKFLIDFEQKGELLENCRGLLQPDPHGSSGTYRVTSQYYDSPGYSMYLEKLDGVHIRKKIRLRFYGRLPSAKTFFMEVKHREDRIIRKERVPLPEKYARDVLKGSRSLKGLTRFAGGSETAGRVELDAYQMRLVPTAVISYLREAWMGRLEPGLRLTFDQFCCSTRAGRFHPGVEARPLHGSNLMIMEVKFDKALPNWLATRINRIGANPIRFSKYAEGVEALRR